MQDNLERDLGIVGTLAPIVLSLSPDMECKLGVRRCHVSEGARRASTVAIAAKAAVVGDTTFYAGIRDYGGAVLTDAYESTLKVIDPNALDADTRESLCEQLGNLAKKLLKRPRAL